MTLQQIKSELRRLGATEATATLDDEFAPEAGELVKVEIEGAYWHLLPDRFLRLLNDLPDGAGSEAIRTAIAQNAIVVWHGPAPEGSRDLRRSLAGA